VHPDAPALRDPPDAMVGEPAHLDARTAIMPTGHDPDNVMESRELRKAGLKVTHPRMRVLEILEASRSHLTAEDIYKRLLGHEQDIGLATVYRVLTQFEAAGLVTKHNFEGGQAVYELADHSLVLYVRPKKKS
jgi:Fe2+ or Zn2+ uptake regulation protein